MYAKIEDGKVIFPPHHDGNHFNVHLDRQWLSEHGYTDMTEEETAPYLPKPQEPTVFSKLAIRRAMRTLQIEYKLNQLLSASDTFRNDWTDAQQIDLGDPVLVQALSYGGITEQEIVAIKNAITGEV